MHRRQFIGTLAGTVSIGLAGCLDVLSGGPVEFEANPVTVSDAAVGDAGYSLAGVNEMVIEREFEVADRSQEVRVTNQQAQYEKALELGPLGSVQAGVFTVLSTPQVRVLEREFNPVAEMSTGDLAEMVQESYEGLDGLERVGAEERSILGQSTNHARFEGSAALSGTDVEVIVHLTEAVETEEDLVVVVAVHPSMNPREADHVVRMMEGVRAE